MCIEQDRPDMTMIYALYSRNSTQIPREGLEHFVLERAVQSIRAKRTSLRHITILNSNAYRVSQCPAVLVNKLIPVSEKSRGLVTSRPPDYYPRKQISAIFHDSFLT